MGKMKGWGDWLTRRGFLSGSGLLLSGALLGSAKRSEAQEASAAPKPGGNATEEFASVIWDLVAANRILAEQGVIDGYGHVSVRHPANPQRYLMTHSLAPESVTPDDLIEFDLDSNQMDTKGRKPQTERFIHGGFYKARPDVNAVVHFHAPPCVVMSVCGEPMRPVYHMAGFVGDGIPVFDIRKFAGATDMLISNLKLGSDLAQTLGDKPAVLLRGHGAASVGESLPYAVCRAIYLTINAQMQIQLLGKNAEYLSPEEAKLAGSQNGYPKDWELWKKKAMDRYTDNPVA